MKIRVKCIDYSDSKEMATVYAIEKQCFPIAEQDSFELIYNRAKNSPECFWLLENTETGTIIGFLNGVPMDRKDFTESVFTDISLYNKNGPWVMLISLDIAPQYQLQGLSRVFITKVLEEIKARKIYQGAVFICKKHLVKYYATFGFVDEGISVCKHGGASWHQMRMVF